MRGEFDHLDDEALEYLSQGVIHRKEYPERVQRMEIEIAHRKAKKRMQELARFNMENDTKLGVMPRASNAWVIGVTGREHDERCKCDIHQLMAFGHDADCKEKN